MTPIQTLADIEAAHGRGDPTLGTRRHLLHELADLLAAQSGLVPYITTDGHSLVLRGLTPQVTITCRIIHGGHGPWFIVDGSTHVPTTDVRAAAATILRQSTR